MKKGILILICFCSLTGLCLGQNKNVDSLLQVLKTAKEDTSKINTVIALAYESAKKNPDTGLYFANEALVLATKLNDKMEIADAHLVIGRVLIYAGKYKEALKNFKDVLPLCEELLNTATKANKSKILKRKANAFNSIVGINQIQGNYTEASKNLFIALRIFQEIGNKKGSAYAYNNLGLIDYRLGNYPEALKNFLAALKIQEEIGDKSNLAGSYNNIGAVYMDQNNFSEALKNYLTALKIYEELDDKRGKAENLTNIGSVYDFQGNHAEALKNFFAAIKLEEEFGDKVGEAVNLNNIGTVYFTQGNYSEALRSHLAALKINEEIGDKQQVAYTCTNIGNNYLKMHKNNEALLYLNKGLSLAKDIGSLNDLKNSYSWLAKLDSAQGNFKQAFENHKMYIIYRDSLVNKENSKKMVQIQMQYEFDKKESLAKAGQEEKDALALKELQKQKLLRNFSIGAIGLVVVLFLFVYRIYRSRQLLRLNDIRNKIAGDLHDDIGSTLNSISIYSEVAKQKGENYDEALEMIGDASRKVIEAMSDIVWTINAENDSFEKIIFRMTSHAYNLFHARNIEFTFHADEILNEKKLSLEERRNFYLIFKEAVNNLVKYSNATHVSITFTNENNWIKLRIRDDGIGFDTSKENAGNGLKNMKRRADEMKAEFKIESQTGNGTQIDLILKA